MHNAYVSLSPLLYTHHFPNIASNEPHYSTPPSKNKSDPHHPHYNRTSPSLSLDHRFPSLSHAFLVLPTRCYPMWSLHLSMRMPQLLITPRLHSLELLHSHGFSWLQPWVSKEFSQNLDNSLNSLSGSLPCCRAHSKIQPRLTQTSLKRVQASPSSFTRPSKQQKKLFFSSFPLSY